MYSEVYYLRSRKFTLKSTFSTSSQKSVFVSGKLVTDQLANMNGVCD